jgi:hypothetical protein
VGERAKLEPFPALGKIIDLAACDDVPGRRPAIVIDPLDMASPAPGLKPADMGADAGLRILPVAQSKDAGSDGRDPAVFPGRADRRGHRRPGKPVLHLITGKALG